VCELHATVCYNKVWDIGLCTSVNYISKYQLNGLNKSVGHIEVKNVTVWIFGSVGQV
jgi:hypothetical protein